MAHSKPFNQKALISTQFQQDSTNDLTCFGTVDVSVCRLSTVLSLAKIPIKCRIKYIDLLSNWAISHAKLASCCAS
jgi:hypothetical protein